MTCSWVLPHFCLHFQYVRVDALTYTHKIFMVKVEGAVGKNTPVKNVRKLLDGRNSKTCTRKFWGQGQKNNSLAHPRKSISSGNFWENLTGTFLRGQHQAQVLWNVTVLFHVCHLCTATKVICKTSYLGAQRLFFLRRQYPELQKLLAGYGKRKLFNICIRIWLNIIILFKTSGKEKKTKQDISLSAVH